MRNRRLNSWSNTRTKRAGKASSRSTRNSRPSPIPSCGAPSCWRWTGPTRRNSATPWNSNSITRKNRKRKFPSSSNQPLDKIDEVGRGIAVAFVATLYGVGAANLILLPAAGKLKIRIRDEQIIREMMLEGAVSILEGMNPRMLREKLLGFLTEANKPVADADAAAAGA